MKKLLFTAIVCLLLVVALAPVYAEITKKEWLGTTYKGDDDYYDMEVNAYETLTTAVLAVTVKNDKTFTINITKVYVTFDWRLNYTSVQVNATNPETLEKNEVRVFFINFQVPNISVASNLYTHSYTIVTEYFYPNATNPSQKLTGSYEFFDDDFAVYSADQADAVDLKRIIGTFSPPSTPPGWQSAKARILWNKALKEKSSGIEYYRQGEFTRAEQSFSTTLDYIDDAWDAEEAYLTAKEELDFQKLEAEVRNLDAMSSLFNGLSIMWTYFGIGGILFGIGYIVKWLAHMRRPPKPPEAPKA
jgi:hypothetical protein